MKLSLTSSKPAKPPYQTCHCKVLDVKDKSSQERIRKLEEIVERSSAWPQMLALLVLPKNLKKRNGFTNVHLTALSLAQQSLA